MATPVKVTSAKQAVEQIRDKTYNPWLLSDYLRLNTFRTVVDRNDRTVGERSYFAGLFNPGYGDIVSFQHSQPFGQPQANIRAWFVPQVSVDRLVENRNKFPDGTLATIDLARSQPPFICTEKLTGCCLVMGWDRTNRRLYLGHIGPSSVSVDRGREFIADYVRSHEIFPVPKSQLSKEIYLGGHDDVLPISYRNSALNVIGCIASNRIRITFQVPQAKPGPIPQNGYFEDFE